MKRPFSLGGHVLIGAVLWTIGLFAVAGIVITHAILTEPRAAVVFHAPFRHSIPIWLMAIGCLAAGMWLIRRGLSPVTRLRERLADVHHGRAQRLEGTYPSEIQPLVEDLNALLDHREQVIARALTKAGDLAHGLKTPLAVLAHDADLVRSAGRTDLAAAISQQVDRMRRQIDYHLAHARAAAAGATLGSQCSVRDSAEGLVRALQRLHADRGLTLDIHVDAGHRVRTQREDLDEMLGNLLDNACKWARTRVAITSTIAAAAIVITVDDDGAGLEPNMWTTVLNRGVRADEAAPGTGLGLAIVRDLAALYGGTIAIDKAPIGGLRAALNLPAASNGSTEFS